jgi:hypothetical protein
LPGRPATSPVGPSGGDDDGSECIRLILGGDIAADFCARPAELSRGPIHPFSSFIAGAGAYRVRRSEPMQSVHVTFPGRRSAVDVEKMWITSGFPVKSGTGQFFSDEFRKQTASMLNVHALSSVDSLD